MVSTRRTSGEMVVGAGDLSHGMSANTDPNDMLGQGAPSSVLSSVIIPSALPTRMPARLVLVPKLCAQSA